jgi:hypothetical protein
MAIKPSVASPLRAFRGSGRQGRSLVASSQKTRDHAGAKRNDDSTGIERMSFFMPFCNPKLTATCQLGVAGRLT